MKKLIETLRLINQPCENMTELLSKSLDTRLPFGHRLAYKLHLLYCTACRRYKRQLLFLRAMLRRVAELADAGVAPGAGLSPQARERISRALRDR